MWSTYRYTCTPFFLSSLRKDQLVLQAASLAHPETSWKTKTNLILCWAMNKGFVYIVSVATMDAEKTRTKTCSRVKLVLSLLSSKTAGIINCSKSNELETLSSYIYICHSFRPQGQQQRLWSLFVGFGLYFSHRQINCQTSKASSGATVIWLCFHCPASHSKTSLVSLPCVFFQWPHQRWKCLPCRLFQ